jgi:hypothetical protein
MTTWPKAVSMVDRCSTFRRATHRSTRRGCSRPANPARLASHWQIGRSRGSSRSASYEDTTPVSGRRVGAFGSGKAPVLCSPIMRLVVMRIKQQRETRGTDKFMRGAETPSGGRSDPSARRRSKPVLSRGVALPAPRGSPPPLRPPRSRSRFPGWCAYTWAGRADGRCGTAGYP